MQQADTLQLLAELAVAFAGFTGLVGALRSTRSEDRAFRGELRLLIEFSLYLMLSAVVPLFLWQAGVSAEGSWRIASLAHSIFVVVYYARRWPSLSENARALGAVKTAIGTLVFEVPLMLLLLANALALLPWEPHVAYLANLFYQLVATSLSFMRFASPLWREPAS
jgi:hypothetical protein